MSFGFSAGDFITAANLIRDVILAIKGNSRSEYHALELELYALQRALFEIEHLKAVAGQEIVVSSVKAAALMCQYSLNEFLSKLKRYEAEFSAQLGVGKDGKLMNRFGKSGHVGSLNMRLTTLGLEIMSSGMAAASDRDGKIQAGMARQFDLLEGNMQKVGSIYELISGKLIPQLQGLMGLVGKVWTSNIQILSYITNIQNGSTSIDVRHTWFQEPMKLEDAFGRLLPIPPEYGWSTFQAIIQEQFSSGPGHDKVFAGEYELFCTEDSSKVITEQTLSLLRPGAGITMAIVIGRYNQGLKDICPKPGCASKHLTRSEAGGMICGKCQTWFGVTHKAFPRPFRSTDPEYLESIRLKNRNRPENFLQEVFQKLRDDRRWFKNLRVEFTEMPTAMVAADRQGQTEGVGEMPSLSSPSRESEESSYQNNLKKESNNQELERQWSAIAEIIRSSLESFNGAQLDDEIPFWHLGADSLWAAEIRYRANREVSTIDLHPVLLLNENANMRAVRSFIYHGTITFPQQP